MLERLNRRDLLSFLGGTVAVSLAGCLRGQSAATNGTNASPQSMAQSMAQPTPTPPHCIVRPQQTEGPYFIDEGLNRSDIRSDPSDGSIRPGIPLRLTFQVTQTDGRSCVPLSGAIVDIWHCDALGVYSDVVDRGASTVGQKFLRGAQTTDANGTATFTTIYPGWYPGRAVHIHFKIRTAAAAQQGYEFTSQLYFDDALSDRIRTLSPYAANGQRHQRNNQDRIFQQGGEDLMLQLTEEAQGYVSTFTIGLQLPRV
ncbi:MAG: intradiol ring-cleavage dioxygenase [Leptolyngbyaceae cyanobacterium SL_7_1]|nr:intradiol ring-cleavage dioxygenase [Leptolyngbyaceae cyanobacterium SL_7_1]